MIKDIVLGDITAKANPADIIIGMNTSLREVAGIGRPFVKDSIPAKAIQLGSVISFDFDGTRRLHMLICHELKKGGWDGADRHIRFGLDYLDQMDREDNPKGSGRQFSIVCIGTGKIGHRDGADVRKINAAINNSFLDMTLYKLDPPRVSADIRVLQKPIKPFQIWSPDYGEQEIRIAA